MVSILIGRAMFKTYKRNSRNILPNSLHVCDSTVGNENLRIISLGHHRTVRIGRHRRERGYKARDRGLVRGAHRQGLDQQIGAGRGVGVGEGLVQC